MALCLCGCGGTPLYKGCRWLPGHNKKFNVVTWADAYERLIKPRLVTEGECMVFAPAWSRRGVDHGTIKFGGRHHVVSRVTYQTFRGPIPPDRLVMHTCDRVGCCNPNHLRIGTPSENSKDMVAKGRSAKGDKIGTSRLTSDDVIAIRHLRDYGVRCRELARMFKVSQATVSHVSAPNPKTWRHLKAS